MTFLFERMILSESFEVATTIEKLPPVWKDFKNYLKNKQKEMNIEEYIIRFQIEEDNMSSKQKVKSYCGYKNKSRSSGGRGAKLGPKCGIFMKKSQGKYFNCNKVGHKSLECRLSKNNNKEANIVD